MRQLFARFVPVIVLAAASCSSSPAGIARPSACGGTVTTGGQIDAAAFSANYIRVEGVNDKFIVVYLADTTKPPELTFSVSRDATSGQFPTGSVMDNNAALSDPNRVGTATLNVGTVVDPYDSNGSPLTNADGGSVGSIDATFTATFTGASITGSFSSPVCATTQNI